MLQYAEASQLGLLRIVRDRDVAPEAYRDVFTAVLRRPS
jgi:hypothetical protein